MEGCKLYQVFYTKDIKKKKKVYNDGYLICLQKKSKLFNAEGQCILIVTNKNPPQLDVEYILNYTYLILAEKQLPYEDYVSGKIFIDKSTIVIPVKKQIKKTSLHKIQNIIEKQFTNGLKIQSFIFKYLRPHQIQGVSFMFQCITGLKGINIQGCILADFMGLGKTLQTLTLIRCILIQKLVQKVIVICPLTLVKVWQKQCKKWMDGKLNPLVAIGSPQEIGKKIRMFVDYQYRFMIVSYENYYKNSDNLNKKCDLMIFDEGHRLKNKNSKLLKKIKMAKCKKRILLTGTPLQNNLSQLYTCISLVNPIFFQSQSLFRNVFQKPIIAGMAKNANYEQRQLAISRTGQLANRIKQFSLRRKADVLEQYLPKKKQYQIFFKLSAIQTSIYSKLMKKKTQDDPLSMINMLRKLFTHPIIFKNDRFQHQQLKDYNLDDCRNQTSCKIEFIKYIALECKRKQEKLIIVSYFTETLDFIQNMLKEQEQDVSVCKLDGRIGAEERFRVIESFINNKDVLLLSGKAGGTGLTLICACKMIMIEPDWNPSNDSQVMGRVWRQGQTKQVQIYRLFIACSIQQKILQRQQLKESLSQKLIDNKANNTSYDFLSLKELFIEMSQKCITYPQQKNKAPQFISKHPQLNSSSIIFVNTKESHENMHKKIKNQFQDAQFIQQSQQQQQFKQQGNDDLNDDMDRVNQELLGLMSKNLQINNQKIETNNIVTIRQVQEENKQQQGQSSDQTESLQEKSLCLPPLPKFQQNNLSTTQNQQDIKLPLQSKKQQKIISKPYNYKLPVVLQKLKKKYLQIPLSSSPTINNNPQNIV